MDVIELYNSGFTVVEIAIKSGQRQAVIRGLLRVDGVYLRSRGPKNPYKQAYEARRAANEMQN